MHMISRFFQQSVTTEVKDITPEPSEDENTPSTHTDNENEYAENLKATKELEDEISLSTCKDKENSVLQSSTNEVVMKPGFANSPKNAHVATIPPPEISENFGEGNSSSDVHAEKSVQVGYSEEHASSMQNIILNARKVLMLSKIQGISLHEFLNVYNLKFSTALENEIKKCGHSELKEFLLSILSQVPLKISSDEGLEIVHLDSTVKVMKELLPYNKPLGIASSVDKYKSRSLPPDYDFTQYVPGYLSYIGDPDFIYVQPFTGDLCSNNFEKLQQQLLDFYSGEWGEAYQMKSNDIKEKQPCVVHYPNDQVWHRGIIEKLISVEEVKVSYVDYGVIDTAKIDELRYIRRDFMELASFAMRARLANLKPAKTEDQDGKSWSPVVTSWMVNWCSEKLLNIRIKDIQDGILSLIVYDTEGDRKIFLHDALVKEKFAEMLLPAEMEKDECIKKIYEETANTTLWSLNNLNLNPTNNTQPKMLSPSYISHSAYYQKRELKHPVVQPVSTSPLPSNHNSVNTTNMSSTSVVEDCPEVFGGRHLYGEYGASGALSPTPSIVFPLGRRISSGNFSSTSDVSSLDVMSESVDNEDYFAKVCQEIDFPYKKTIKKKSVRRITTTDGYAFHLLLYDSQPYISSGEVSFMIWSNKKPSYLYHKLQLEEIDMQPKLVMKTGNEEFFILLRRFQIKGIEPVKGTKADTGSSILILPLIHVIKILNMFGQPSSELRFKISLEFINFNPNAVCWQESLKKVFPAEIKTKKLSDDDRLNQLCLNDLNQMKKGINLRRKQLLERAHAQHYDLEVVKEVGNEINQLRQLLIKVKQRIVEVNQVCERFSHNNW